MTNAKNPSNELPHPYPSLSYICCPNNGNENLPSASSQITPWPGLNTRPPRLISHASGNSPKETSENSRRSKRTSSKPKSIDKIILYRHKNTHHSQAKKHGPQNRHNPMNLCLCRPSIPKQANGKEPRRYKQSRETIFRKTLAVVGFGETVVDFVCDEGAEEAE